VLTRSSTANDVSVTTSVLKNSTSLRCSAISRNLKLGEGGWYRQMFGRCKHAQSVTLKNTEQITLSWGGGGGVISQLGGAGSLPTRWV